jgi:trehalose 6-phosphate phosphatase
MQWIDAMASKRDAALPPPSLPAAGQRISVFLDLDGTLVPFQARPEQVRVDEDMLGLLSRLQHLLQGGLAVLTGRDLGDMDRMLSPLRLPAGALHGLQCRDAKGRVRAKLPSAESAGRIERACADALATLPGVHLERKGGVAFALHYRTAREQERAALAAAEAIARESAGHYRVQAGNCVVELKPTGADKGDALRTLAHTAPFRDRRPWMLGDDLTDEPAFAMAESLGGVGVVVGGRRPSQASHALCSTAQARRWLARLVRHLERLDASA